MFIRNRVFSAVAVVWACSGPALAQSDPQPGLVEFFSVNRIGTFVANTAIAALRTQMEVEYDFLTTDLLRGQVAISGVIARPLLPFDQARQCEIKVDRAVLSTDLAKPFEVASEMTVNFIGARAAAACFPPDMAMGLRAIGMREVNLDQFKLRVAYVYTTGETSAEASLAINGFGTLDYAASGMILPRMGPHGPNNPAIRVLRAVVSLKDQGGWQKVSQSMPPNMTDPETIRVIGTETVTQFLSDNGSRPVSAVEQNFVTQLMEKVADFVRDPGEITIEATLPPNGIVIEPDAYRRGPQALVAALALAARASPLSRTHILSGADLAALADGAEIDTPRRLELARALLDGAGVPQAPSAALALLAPVAQGSPEAAFLIARAMEQDSQKAELAYGYALRAAAGGIGAAVPLIDRLEARVGTVAVVKTQNGVTDGAPATADLPGDSDPRSLRRLALAHLTGLGKSRSYPRAYYFALLAEAAGDIGATALKDEIDGRFSDRGDEVQHFWDAQKDALRAAALRDWIEQGLADRYRTQ